MCFVETAVAKREEDLCSDAVELVSEARIEPTVHIGKARPDFSV